MRKTLLQGGYYIPSHSTDIRETFKRITQNKEVKEPLVAESPLVEKVLSDSAKYVKTLRDFDHILGER